jgi:hypothetical protein
MSHLRRLWAGMRTRENADAETDSRVALVIGNRQLNFADGSQDDQGRGQANLYEFDVANDNIVPENLNDNSIRVTILGNDAWRPQDVVAWGERFTGGAITPLAIETGISAQLSTDPGEGNASLALRLVAQGSAGMRINRLLVMMTTASAADSGTDDRISLRVTTGAGIEVVHFDIPDTPQLDQETGQANFYFVPVDSPFTRAGLGAGAIRLSTSGTDAWSPASFFIFGLDDAAGRPEQLVPLVNVRRWNLGQLSTDPTEGNASVTLPLLP